MRFIFSHTFWVFTAAAICAGILLHVSQKVQQAESHLATLESQIEEEQSRIRVLGAEWEYLNTPQRLEMLSGEYLELVPSDSGVASVAADELPVMEDVVPAYNVEEMQVDSYRPASYSTQEGR